MVNYNSVVSIINQSLHLHFLTRTLVSVSYGDDQGQCCSQPQHTSLELDMVVAFTNPCLCGLPVVHLSDERHCSSLFYGGHIVFVFMLITTLVGCSKWHYLFCFTVMYTSRALILYMHDSLAILICLYMCLSVYFSSFLYSEGWRIRFLTWKTLCIWSSCYRSNVIIQRRLTQSFGCVNRFISKHWYLQQTKCVYGLE